MTSTELPLHKLQTAWIFHKIGTFILIVINLPVVNLHEVRSKVAMQVIF